jgi:Asp-tRNA(Asn)/Glu-tRNA(Gln) amidotransferase A subunit family amidase
MPNRLPLSSMAEMIRERRLSPVELMDAHYRQIACHNPQVNAFVVLLEEQARASAKRAEDAVMRGEPLGSLHGVPVTVKDSFDMIGLPTLCGSKFRLGHRAAADATAVSRLRSSGAIVVGKTNCPEFLSNYETDNYITGRTNNPWNLEYTPGGSSGGESAAIAAFCSAGGIGSDGGGSVRIPAHFCGIAGLKPTPGRISAAGHFPVISHPGGLLGVAGPMARSAEDVRRLFTVLAGYDSQDPFSAPVPFRTPDVAGMRIGLMEQFSEVPVQPEIRTAVQSAARTLEQIGFKVEPFKPHGLQRTPNLWWFFFGQLPAPLTKQLIEGREQEAHWTGTEFLDAALKENVPVLEDLVFNLATRDRLRAALLREMENVPLILAPACGVHAFKHRERRWPTGAKTIGLFEAMMPVTPWNLLGLPAAVVPFTLSDLGLPIGVQLIGRPWEEETILEVAVRLEDARGPFPAPPGFSN